MLEQGFSGVRDYAVGDFVLRPPYFLHADEAGAGGALFLRLSVSRERWRLLRERRGWRPVSGSFEISAAEWAGALSYEFGGDFLLDRAKIREQETYDRTKAMNEAAERIAGGHAAISVLADAMNMPLYEFSRRFLRAQGSSPAEFRRNAKLQRGMKMLAETDDSLSAVAQDCGFFDQSHFSRELKRATSLSPRAFRRWADVN